MTICEKEKGSYKHFRMVYTVDGQGLYRWLWLDYCLSYCMPNIMFMGKPACMYSTASYCEANQWLLIKATIEAVATNLLVTFLLERDIYGQASILGQAQGLVVVTQLRAAMKGWGMTHLTDLSVEGWQGYEGGSRGVVGYDEEKGVLCHTEQILELYIVNFRLLNFTLRRKGLPLKGDENCLFRASTFI